MGRKLIIGTGVAGACALVLAGAPSASAMSDTTAPVLKLSPSAEFVAGTQIGESTGPFGDHPQTDFISQRVSWSATDASGICGYDVFKVYAGKAPEKVVSMSAETSFADVTTDYDDQQGGGTFKVLSWKVVAHDCAGNSSSASSRVLPVVTQETNTTYGYKGVQITYAGTWNSSICKCWSGDRDTWTVEAGAQATITRQWAAADRVALVMETAPDRGAFELLVDGVHRADIDTNSAIKVHRAVVWAGRLNAGEHTITLVNAATAGHPRIDLDAVLSNSKFYCNC